MECNINHNVVTLDANKTENEASVRVSDSSEDFQKFLYDLFDKNGILNDLRACLRGHIIDVLKKAQLGASPLSQVRFTERLSLTFQAINILIAEYLLQQKFHYSLSVFLSEIPLANMVFLLSKTLLDNNVDLDSDLLRFQENDIWSILNYLGVQCSSDHALDIVSKYQGKEKPSFLLCLLKCLPLHKEKEDLVTEFSSVGSSPSNSVATDFNKSKPYKHKQKGKQHVCNHFQFCHSCQNRLRALKLKYTREKENSKKNANEFHHLNLEDDGLLKDEGVLERNLVDEMFEQLKSVYESELEMVRGVEKNKMERCFEDTEHQLEKERNQLQGEFRNRQLELELYIQKKKKFLWELAQSLRQQHEHMERAMQAVKEEGKRLTCKEENLKQQLVEAEELLRRRGEEMRNQISDELRLLENHLQDMKHERDNITLEREELAELKQRNLETHSHTHHCELLEKELEILKKYIDASKFESNSKSVRDTSSLTDLHDVTSKISLVLNNDTSNEKIGDRSKCRSRKSNGSVDLKSTQVVNDLKKQKNVNFCSETYIYGGVEIPHEKSRSNMSTDIASSTDDGVRDIMDKLREDNNRLTAFASQQRVQLDEMLSYQARLQAELTATRRTLDSLMAPPRPTTAAQVLAPVEPFHVTLHRASTSTTASSTNQRKGAGEQLSVLPSSSPPRVLVPGDSVPFLGKLGNHRSDMRRHTLNECRLLRNITSVAEEGNIAVGPADDDDDDDDTNATTSMHYQRGGRVLRHERLNVGEENCNNGFTYRVKHKNVVGATWKPGRVKDRWREHNATLHEAKMKLKRLAIEAEAVERSYLEFRRRRTERIMLSTMSSPVVEPDSLGSPYTHHHTTEAEAVERSYLEFRRRRTERIMLSTMSSPVVEPDSLGSPYTHHHTTDVKPTHFPRDSPIVSTPHASSCLKRDFDKYLKEYNGKYDIFNDHFKNKATALKTAKPIPETVSRLDRFIATPNVLRENLIETPMSEFRKYYHARHDSKIKSKLKPSKNKVKSMKFAEKSLSPIMVHEASRKENDDKTKLVTKVEPKLIDPKEKTEESETKGLENGLKVICDLGRSDIEAIESLSVQSVIDGECVEVNTPLPSMSNLLVYVENSLEKVAVPDGERMEITMIVSPKGMVNENLDHTGKSASVQINGSLALDPESPSYKARIKTELSQSRKENISYGGNNSQHGLEETTSGSSDMDIHDDFSADVDNYNSGSDYGSNSPISLPKTGDDDFWNT